MPDQTAGEFIQVFVVTLHDEIHNDEGWAFTDRDRAICHAKKVAEARWVVKPRAERNVDGYIFFLPFSEENDRVYIHIKKLQVKNSSPKPVQMTIRINRFSARSNSSGSLSSSVDR